MRGGRVMKNMIVKKVGRKIEQMVYLGTAPEGEEGDEEQNGEGGG